MLGVNLSGAEFGGSAGSYGKAYIYPSLKDIKLYADQGVDLIRLPFKWERMQKTLGGDLDPAELARMKTFLANAETAGVKVVIDAHNYGRYGGQVIGGAVVSTADFADFWGRMASALSGQPALAGYDLMNEPHDMGGATRWPAAAQAAVNAIRKADMTHDIYVEGDGWSSAATWQRINGNLHIADPANRIVYEAHEYFDRNNSGTYQGDYDAEKATPDIGVTRLKPFADWLEANKAKGFIGEFSVPKDDPRWLVVLDNFLDALDRHGIGGAYWGAGPWWGNYREALMTGGVANPQLAVLLDHLGDAGQIDAADPGAVRGTAGNDTMNGGGGADTLQGLAGNDHLAGKAGDDVLIGGAGNDKIEGGAGDDLMIGGTGNDHYFVDAAGDTIVEHAGEGIDTVDASIGYVLPDGVENLTLRSSAAIDGTGNALANTIIGNAGANRLSGGAGDDVLQGGGGGDFLTGGAGDDRFVFATIADSGGSRIDTILDFRTGDDRIDLGRIDADTTDAGNQPFHFIGKAAFGHDAGALRAVVANGRTTVEGDVNGDGKADSILHLDGSHLLSGGDFIL